LKLKVPKVFLDARSLRCKKQETRGFASKASEERTISRQSEKSFNVSAFTFHIFQSPERAKYYSRVRQCPDKVRTRL